MKNIETIDQTTQINLKVSEVVVKNDLSSAF